MPNATRAEIDAAVLLMQRVAKEATGETFAEITRKMASVALNEAFRIRNRIKSAQELLPPQKPNEPTQPPAPELFAAAVKKLDSDLKWLGPNGHRQAYAVLPRNLAEALYSHCAGAII